MQTDWYNAVENLLPTLMESRLKAWGPADIDHQGSCLFYNGRIPREITDLIFEFALYPHALKSRSTTPYPNPGEDGPGEVGPGHDFEIRHDHKQNHEESAPRSVAQDAEAKATGLPAAAGSATGNPADADASLATPVDDFDNRMLRSPDRGFDWFRPDYSGKEDFRGVGLLQTCRRVYLDTHELLRRARGVSIFEGRAPPVGFRAGSGSGVYAWTRSLAGRFRNQLPQIRSVHLFAQMYRLEYLMQCVEPSRTARAAADPVGRPLLLSKLSQGLPPAEPVWRTLHNLEHFHLTIRRTDWWRWEENDALSFDPYRHSAGPSVRLMREDMNMTMVEGRLPSTEGSTALIKLCQAMRNLKTLRISFETSEDKKEEMEEIVAWAKTWRFDIMSWRHWVGERVSERAACLVAEDKPVEKMSWRGFPHHWSDQCTACGSPHPRPGCTHCLEKQRLIQQDKGPRLLIWTVTWRPEPVDKPDDVEVNEPGNAQGATGSQQ